MYLSVSSGAIEIVLSGTSPVRGCTYFPGTAQQQRGEWQPVTETAEVNLSGTAAAIRTVENSLNALFLLAAQRAATGVGERVFVNYKPVDGDSVAYRSEITEGRVVWSTNPGLRRLGDTSPFVQWAVIWTRAYWWEGAETEAALSANGQVAATGGRTVTNDPANGNWVNAGSAQLTGVLPTPARVVMTNNSGGTRTYTRVFLAVNANSDPYGLTHYLQGEARNSGGTVTADATCSGGSRLDFVLSGSTATYIWSLTQANMQRTNGRRARILARFVNTSGELLITPQLRYGGLPTWSGDEMALATLIYGEWVDLGIVPLPPGGYSTNYTTHYLGLRFRGTGIGTLDVLQLSMLDSYRVIDLSSSGIAVVNGASLVLDGIEGLAYIQTSGANASIPAGIGGQIMLQPGLSNRIYIVHNLNEVDNYASISTTFSVQVFYRPRRLTV